MVWSGTDVLQLFPGLLGSDRLILIGDQDVALAAGEGLPCLAGALVLHRNVLEERRRYSIASSFGLALLELRPVGGEDVPPRATGGERVGVMTSTPSLIRSSQPAMPFGLPLRTARATTESVTMPLCSSAFQSSATSPALTNRVMSGSSEKRNDVRRQPTLDRPALVAGGAEGGLELHAGPLGRRLEERDECLVSLTRGGVGDERQGDVLGGGREWSQATECRDRYRPSQPEQRLAPRKPSLEKPPVASA